ncbi:MAG: hypothetical protein DLM68_07300, partial [Hyphomicrobiales bacterium]
ARAVAIDPATPWADEQARLDAYVATNGIRIEQIVLTHHHVDHVGDAARLAAKHGAPVIVTSEYPQGFQSRLVQHRRDETPKCALGFEPVLPCLCLFELVAHHCDGWDISKPAGGEVRIHLIMHELIARWGSTDQADAAARSLAHRFELLKQIFWCVLIGLEPPLIFVWPAL